MIRCDIKYFHAHPLSFYEEADAGTAIMIVSDGVPVARIAPKIKARYLALEPTELAAINAELGGARNGAVESLRARMQAVADHERRPVVCNEAGAVTHPSYCPPAKSDTTYCYVRKSRRRKK